MLTFWVILSAGLALAATAWLNRTPASEKISLADVDRVFAKRF